MRVCKEKLVMESGCNEKVGKEKCVQREVSEKFFLELSECDFLCFQKCF